MAKTKSSAIWIEQGYRIFAKEGLEGIQIERLARILDLNKSGFYHYFGELQIFLEELVDLHFRKVAEFTHDTGQAKNIDPDYLSVLMKHSTSVMFQVQLRRHPNNALFFAAGEKVDALVDAAVRGLWAEYLGIDNNPDLASRYYNIVRDMFYTRISFENLNYPYLHALVDETRELMRQVASEIAEGKEAVKGM